MRVVLFLAAATSFVIYGVAIQRFFARPDGMPLRMRLLSSIASVSAIVHMLSLALLDLNAPAWRYLALFVYLAGFALFAWAWHETRKRPLALAFSTTPSPRLVTTGPYALTRHPFYVAYSLTWVAGTLATTSGAVVVAAGVMIAMYIGAARSEERVLTSGALGAAYREYARR